MYQSLFSAHQGSSWPIIWFPTDFNCVKRMNWGTDTAILLDKYISNSKKIGVLIDQAVFYEMGLHQYSPQYEIIFGVDNSSSPTPTRGPDLGLQQPTSSRDPQRPCGKPAGCQVCLSLAPFKRQQAEQQAWRSEDMKWPPEAKKLDVHRLRDLVSNCKAANRRASNWEGACEQGVEITLTPFRAEGDLGLTMNSSYR